MVDNAPIQQLKHGELTIEGYSRAAVQTYWRVPEYRLGFDLGAQPWDFMGTPNWFITHTHLDHIAALPLYLARRRMMKMEPPTVYLPAHAIGAVNQMLDGFCRLDRGKLPAQFIGVEPGDEIDYSRELAVTVHPTFHSIPSVGFLVWERRHKLKREYAELTGDQIRGLRLAGTPITDEVRIPMVAYLGDTAPRALDENPEFYQAKILIAEMTFIAKSHRKELIHKSGHMHLDDFVQRQAKFKNELIIAGHFSTRYNLNQAERIVQAVLPDMLGGRLNLWL
jgi:ribonuclease Z